MSESTKEARSTPEIRYDYSGFCYCLGWSSGPSTVLSRCQDQKQFVDLQQREGLLEGVFECSWDGAKQGRRSGVTTSRKATSGREE